MKRILICIVILLVTCSVANATTSGDLNQDMSGNNTGIAQNGSTNTSGNENTTWVNQSMPTAESSFTQPRIPIFPHESVGTGVEKIPGEKEEIFSPHRGERDILLSDIAPNTATIGAISLSGGAESIVGAGPSSPTHAGSIVFGAGGAKLDCPSSVFVSGNYAYVASYYSHALEIVDISNPAAPVHKGSFWGGGGILSYPNDVYVSGNYAYVAYKSNILAIVDVSNPAAPYLKGCIVNGAGGALLDNPIDVYVSGNYAYVASSYSDALEIVDISNPAAPVHKGSIVNGAGGALLYVPVSVYVSGNYAYVASLYNHALEIVDISNPAAPVHKGSIMDGAGGALLGYPYSVFVAGNYAYVASFLSNALEKVDISNPAAPVHKGSIVHGAGGALLDNPVSVYVAGNYAYVASSYSDALEIVYLSTADPTHWGYIVDNPDLQEGPYCVFIPWYGNYAYVALHDSDAMEIVDISNPAAPSLKGRIVNGSGGALLDGPESVYVAGNYAYVASRGSDALEIVDLINPSNPRPRHKGSIVDGDGGAKLDGPVSVYVDFGYAYVASFSSDALEIVDISNPAAPVHKGSIVDGDGGAKLDGPYSVYVLGNRAYVASFNSDALEIVDISNRAAPVHMGSIANGDGGAKLDGPISVYASGNYAYVASFLSNALEIVDISNSAAPVHKGSIANGAGGALLDGPLSVYVAGNYAYVASGGSDALEIIDISNPAAPVHKGSIVNGDGGALLGYPVGVQVSGNYAYVISTISDSLEIVDIGEANNDCIGAFRPSTHIFYLDWNGNGRWDGGVTDRAYNFGLTGDIPVSGDWASLGKTSIGVYRPSTRTFYLDWNGNGRWEGGVTDRAYNFGLTGDIPVSGDWDALGKTCIGVFRPSTHTFYLDYNGNGVWNGAVTDRAYNFGLTDDKPVSGDWNNIGRTCIGVFRPSTHTFYLDWNGNGRWDGGVTDRAYNFGLTGDIPVSGDWNSLGKTCIGVYRPSTRTFYLDWNGNGKWDGGVTDRAYDFGLTGDQPVSGVWG